MTSKKTVLFPTLAIVIILILAGFALNTNKKTSVLHRPKHKASHSLHHQKTHPRPIAPPTTTLPPPSAKHPLTILSVGDSLGEDLGYGLQDIIGTNPDIRLILDSVGSTGLANVAYYNWPVTLASELSQSHPAIVVILLGGNDAVGFDEGNQVAVFGSAIWRKYYSLRVAKMMTEASKTASHVFWVGLPIMANYSVLPNKSMEILNQIYLTEAKAYHNITYIPTWKLFQDATGNFTQDLKDSSGVLTTVRDLDGVHIAPQAGQELIASYVLRSIDNVEKFHICPSPTDVWRQYNLKGCN